MQRSLIKRGFLILLDLNTLAGNGNKGPKPSPQAAPCTVHCAARRRLLTGTGDLGKTVHSPVLDTGFSRVSMLKRSPSKVAFSNSKGYVRQSPATPSSTSSA